MSRKGKNSIGESEKKVKVVTLPPHYLPSIPDLDVVTREA